MAVEASTGEDEREMADATPSVSLPATATSGLPVEPPAPLAIGASTFRWGQRTYVMGIVNATPDSFSGDGLLGPPAGRDQDEIARAIANRGLAMAEEGADLVDIGGESTRPGYEPIDEVEERRRILTGIAALHHMRPGLPISVDTRRAAVAEAALAAGASMVNDVAAVTDPSDALFRVAAEQEVPIVLMHDRAEARYRSVVAEVIADLQRAVDRAVAAGVSWDRCIIDPGIGFGKTADQNLALLRDLAALRLLGRPVMLGVSRKSTIGRVLDLPAEERLEGTLATTAVGVAAGVDIVRVHDVRANLRTARMADAIARFRIKPTETSPP
jgi:dihydropteroate synthase